jgi:hypothetical protein
MNALIHSFQKDLVTPGKNIVDLLRTAKLIASKLRVSIVDDWIQHELNGYADSDIIPQYRLLRTVEVQCLNPYNGWQLVGNRDGGFQIQIPIAELENSSEGHYVAFPIPQDKNWRIRSTGGLNMTQFPQRILVPMSKIKGIVDAVKTKLLDWSTELESKGIVGEDFGFTPQEVEKASTINYNIGTFQGVFGNVGGTNNRNNIGNISTTSNNSKLGRVRKG